LVQAIDQINPSLEQVFRPTAAREDVTAAKFLIAREPTAYRGFGRHQGISTDGPETFPLDKPVPDLFNDLRAKFGWTAALRLTFRLHALFSLSLVSKFGFFIDKGDGLQLPLRVTPVV
jgi:hypothetical protein